MAKYKDNKMVEEPKRYKDGLKPCPFCARQPKLIEFNDRLWTVLCSCGAESPKESVSKAGAKRIWNRRRWDYQRFVQI